MHAFRFPFTAAAPFCRLRRRRQFSIHLTAIHRSARIRQQFRTLPNSPSTTKSSGHPEAHVSPVHQQPDAGFFRFQEPCHRQQCNGFIRSSWTVSAGILCTLVAGPSRRTRSAERRTTEQGGLVFEFFQLFHLYKIN